MVSVILELFIQKGMILTFDKPEVILANGDEINLQGELVKLATATITICILSSLQLIRKYIICEPEITFNSSSVHCSGALSK
jgi:hypothetical protein